MSQKCRTCGVKARIMDSRAVDKNATRRRYKCGCGDTWTTLEMIIETGAQYKMLRQEMEASANVVGTLAKIRTMINKAIGGKHS